MENLISLVNKIQRACTALGDHGEASALPTLWDSLPAIAVVGGQVFKLSLQFSPFFFSISQLTAFVLRTFFTSLFFLELWKVLGVGKCCWQGFLTSWIR